MGKQQTLITDFIYENQAALYRLAFSYTHNRDAALDIVQDTVVQAISHAAALRDRAVDHLEPKLKTIVILRYFEDLKLEEIAQATGANLNTVKARLYRALKKMREELGYEMSAT